MKFKDICFLTIIIIGAMGMSFFFGHEFGFMNGQEYQKSVNSKTLENCNRIITGIYE